MDNLTKLLYLEKLAENISDNYIIIDENFVIIDYNKKLKREILDNLGISINENFIVAVQNKTDEDISYIYKEIKSLIKSGTDKELIYELKLRNNFKLCLNVIPVIHNEKFVYSLWILNGQEENKTDISKLVQNERLVSLGAMTAGVIHDLKTPISAAQTFIYNLKALINEYKDSLDNENVTKDDYREIADDMQDIVSSAENTIEKISNIVNSVRNFTRNLSGDNTVLFSVRDVINDIRNMIAYRLRHENIDLIYTADEDIKILGDPGKLSQVLTNFIVNSIQAYEQRGGKIEVGAKIKDNCTYITIKDFGKGIPDNIKNKLFKDMITTKGVEGTGLGMYISNSLIKDSFKGEILIDSTEGEGTTINVSIPISINNV